MFILLKHHLILPFADLATRIHSDGVFLYPFLTLDISRTNNICLDFCILDDICYEFLSMAISLIFGLPENVLYCTKFSLVIIHFLFFICVQNDMVKRNYLVTLVTDV